MGGNNGLMFVFETDPVGELILLQVEPYMFDFLLLYQKLESFAPRGKPRGTPTRNSFHI